MKTYITLIITALLFTAGVGFAQLANAQVAPPPPQNIDTLSGWQVVFSDPTLSFKSVQFPGNTDTGFAIAANNTGGMTLVKSTDRGATWNRIPKDIPGNPVFFVTPEIGFANGGLTKVVRKTTDGGLTWTDHERPSVASGDIAFSSKDTGIVFGSQEIVRTVDGGDTWKVLYPPSQADENAVTFGTAKVGYAVGIQQLYPGNDDYPKGGIFGYCERTNDAGATWSVVYTGIQQDLWCCEALGSDTLIVGGTDIIGRTTDGGKTWDTLRIGDDNFLFTKIAFRKHASGLIVGGRSLTQGVILKTTDAGVSWKYEYTPNIQVLYGVEVLDDTIAVACGGSVIYRTTTGGEPILGVHQDNPDFQVQVFPNPTPGIVTIQYQLPESQQVSFRYYDVQGNTLSSTAPTTESSGTHQRIFDGSQLANGIYYFQMSTASGSYTGSFSIQK